MVTPGPVPPQPLTCGVDQYQCVYYFQCLPKSWRCDDELDCADGSDEESCLGQVPGTIPPQGGCPTGQYRCLNHSCLPSILRCDGVPDCPEGEDEYSCRECAFASVKLFKPFKDREPSSPTPPPPLLPPPALQQCKLGELVCEASPGCIPLDKRCDRSADCLPFHADESSCHGNVPLRVLSFKTFSVTRTAVDDFPALVRQKRPSFGDGLKRAHLFRMFILQHTTELSCGVPPRLPALPGLGCCCSLPASLRTSDHLVTTNCQNRLWIFRNESKPHIQPPLGAK